jgi:hypothetical protein
MKKLIILFCIFIFISCSREDDDSKRGCTSDCTTFKGKISTVDGIGINGVSVAVIYYIGTELGSYTRIVARTKTNLQGNYEMHAYIKEDELTPNARGSFSIDVDENQLNKSIPSRYLKPNEVYGATPDMVIYAIDQRNLVFENNYEIPLKANLKINLVGFIPIQEGDFFWVATSFYYGQPNSYSSGISSLYDIGRAKNEFTTINSFTVLNSNTNIGIYKKKNGVFEKTEETEQFKQAQTKEKTYNY